ncbi:MAG: ATP-dependent DNA ligase [Chthoniobacteraceae bacterium]
MKRFTQLFTELDETNRTNEKVAALERYFREAPPADAAWAFNFLAGRKIERAVSSTTMRSWTAEEADLPAWMVADCHEAVGDLAETIALILPEPTADMALPLHQLIEQHLLPLRSLADMAARDLLVGTWRQLAVRERLVWNKLITGGFRVGVSETLVVRALAAAAGIEPAVMAHRVMGGWQPTAADFQQLIDGSANGRAETARPYPFFLASPLEGRAESLGPIDEWQIEWKWDGVRAQLIRREDQALIWTRGDEMVTRTFPEIAEAAAALPDGTVLDGEILAWTRDRPLPFARLQRRLGRKRVTTKMRAEIPVIFLAYDLLESRGEDWRRHPLGERRAQLESLVAAAQHAQRLNPNPAKIGATLEFPNFFEPPLPAPMPIQISEVLQPNSWDELATRQSESRDRLVEGVMLKRRSSAYGAGRERGDWWKWKVDPLVIDAVLLGAQLGHGKRASLYTDYTFGVWDEGELVPVAKAYSGLTDEEILEVDAFVRSHTRNKLGPVRMVAPELVFELAFEGVQESNRHKSGLAVRFPRINRWRRDKKPAEADTVRNLRQFLRL